MEKTIPADKIGHKTSGHWVGFYFSESAQQVTSALQHSIQAELPKNLLWAMPPTWLHTTLFELTMAMREYSEDKDALFERYKSKILSGLATIFAKQPPITIHYTEIEASNKAVIIKGTDDGSFEKLRQKVVEAGLILPGSRTPPDIIHASIFSYNNVSSLEDVTAVTAKKNLELYQTVTAFELLRIGKIPMDNVTKLEMFPLVG